VPENDGSVSQSNLVREGLEITMDFSVNFWSYRMKETLELLSNQYVPVIK
jgi:hypothetical protein